MKQVSEPHVANHKSLFLKTEVAALGRRTDTNVCYVQRTVSGFVYRRPYVTDSHNVLYYESIVESIAFSPTEWSG
jgi:hypothetical protein